MCPGAENHHGPQSQRKSQHRVRESGHPSSEEETPPGAPALPSLSDPPAPPCPGLCRQCLFQDGNRLHLPWNGPPWAHPPLRKAVLDAATGRVSPQDLHTPLRSLVPAVVTAGHRPARATPAGKLPSRRPEYSAGPSRSGPETGWTPPLGSLGCKPTA